MRILPFFSGFFLDELPEQKYRNTLAIMGHLFFLTFILYSIIFYKERLINFDSAYYTFHIIYVKDYLIMHGRTIDYLSQCFPVFGMQRAWPLHSLMLMYSVSFMLLHYLCFNIVTYLFKNVESGIFFALALSLTFRYKYYTGISEIVSTLGFVALLIGWLSSERKYFSKLPKLLFWSIAFGIVLLMNTGHPFALVPMLVFFGYDMVLNGKWKNVAYWVFLPAVAGLYLYRFTQIETGSYEEGQLARLKDAVQVLTNLNDYKIWDVVKAFFRKEYAFPALVFLSAIGWLLKSGKWKTGLYFFLANIAVLTIVIVHNSYLTGDIYYMVDGYLGYIGVVWALTFFIAFLKDYRSRFIVFLTAGLLVFGLHRIYLKHRFFTQRLDYLQELLDKNVTEDQRKFVIRSENYSWKKMWVPSIIAHETMLLSALKGPDSTATIYIGEYGEDIEPMFEKKDLIFGTASELYVDKFPKEYFKFGDEAYVEIKEVPWK